MRPCKRLFTHFDLGHNLHSIPAFIYLIHGTWMWIRYVLNGFIFNLDNINNIELISSLILFVISNVSVFFYVIPKDAPHHPPLLGFPGHIWVSIYYWLVLWAFWNTWLCYRFIPTIYPAILIDNIVYDKILSLFFLLLPAYHTMVTFRKIMKFMGEFHAVQISLWISYILFPINVCLFIKQQEYIHILKCWELQTDFIVSMCYFTNYGYMASFFCVTLYRKQFIIKKKYTFAMLFNFTLIFMGFIPMIMLIIYPNKTSFLNWVTEPIFNGNGNIFGEKSCLYPETTFESHFSEYLNGSVILTILTVIFCGWLCKVLVNYSTKSKIG